jgi:RimJ/RimL family protein N-acetyltransferase
VLRTGYGGLLVDRWPSPRLVLARSGTSNAIRGDAEFLEPDQLRVHVREGSFDVSPPFDPLIRATFPSVQEVPRVILQRTRGAGSTSPFHVRGARIRRLDVSDAMHIADLDSDLAWITRTWGGSVGLATSGHAWGAFADAHLVAVACSFYVGEHFEDVGVVTEPRYRDRGLSTACAAALCRDVEQRGRQASWSTSPGNIASLRVAEKLGFRVQRYDRLLRVDQE